jgi:hypothetical protein
MTEKEYKYKMVLVPIYVGRVHIMITENFAAAQMKFFGDDSPKVLGSEACVQESKGHNYFVYMRPNITHGILAHEAKHIVNVIFKNCGVKLDVENDEPECFLLGWVVDELHRALNNPKLKVFNY